MVDLKMFRAQLAKIPDLTEDQSRRLAAEVRKEVGATLYIGPKPHRARHKEGGS